MTAPDFDTDTALEALDEGIWRGHVARHWYVVAGANGGLPAAQATRAMMLAAGDETRLPRSLTLHYLAAPTEGPIDWRVTVERAGRSATAVSLRATREDGTLLVLGLGWLGTWREDQPEWTERARPDAPPADGLRTIEPPPGAAPMIANYEMRPAPGPRLLSGADESYVAAWLRTARPRPLDHAALAAYTDALFPAVGPRLTAPAFLPTLDLTIHWRAPTAAWWAEHPWVFARFWSEKAAGGLFEENGELWSPDGELLVQSRQLAVLRTAPAQG